MANTSAPLSEVGIANMAAALLAEYPIPSLDHDSPLGRFMAREFGYVRNEMLEAYPWHFAKSRALLPVASTPPFGFLRAYNLPADCLRLLPIRYMGRHDGELYPYEVESNQVLTDYEMNGALPIHYIRRETDPTKFTPLFARALGSRLALLCAQRVTGKASYYQVCLEAYRSALLEAYNADSLSRGTPESQYNNEVLAVRGA